MKIRVKNHWDRSNAPDVIDLSKLQTQSYVSLVLNGNSRFKIIYESRDIVDVHPYPNGYLEDEEVTVIFRDKRTNKRYITRYFLDHQFGIDPYVYPRELRLFKRK